MVVVGLCGAILSLGFERIPVADDKVVEEFGGDWKGTFETGRARLDMNLVIASEAGQPSKAEVRFNDPQRKASPPIRDLKIEGQRISFAITMTGTDMKFIGMLSGDSVGGGVVGFRKGERIGYGNWWLTR